MTEKVSIIMPAYNSEKYIEESIQSVIRQTYDCWELIIVDDCSKDQTKSIISRYMALEERINLIALDKNLGVSEARNRGIAAAKGRYIAFLDSDDIWLEKKLEHQIKFMGKKQAAMSCTQYRNFTESMKTSGRIVDVDEIIDYKNLLKGNSIGCLTVILDRTKLPNIYMPPVHHEDYVTWLNLLKKGFFMYGLKEDLARYRKRKSSLTGNKIRSLSWTWKVYREQEKLSYMEALYYLCHYIFKGIKKHGFDEEKRK